ncbi:hypothetical protein SynPROSU1_02576 [Synechococcus sp. PROS-U-1]|nr:hypothetical protein SynPROSU1_02576 [Synechococcus sp. PROS-U-1]
MGSNMLMHFSKNQMQAKRTKDFCIKNYRELSQTFRSK